MYISIMKLKLSIVRLVKFMVGSSLISRIVCYTYIAKYFLILFLQKVKYISTLSFNVDEIEQALLSWNQMLLYVRS